MSLASCLRTIPISSMDLTGVQQAVQGSASESEGVKKYLSGLVDDLEGIRGQLIAKGHAVAVKNPASINPSPIAKEVLSLKSQNGVAQREENKARLKELHAQWLAENPQPKKAEATVTRAPKGQRGQMSVLGHVVKTPEDFVKVVARENLGSPKETDAQTLTKVVEVMRTLAKAPNRPDVVSYVDKSKYIAAAMNLIDKARQGVAKPEDYAYFRAVEQDFTTPTMAELGAETANIENSMLGSRGLTTAEVAKEAKSVIVETKKTPAFVSKMRAKKDAAMQQHIDFIRSLREDVKQEVRSPDKTVLDQLLKDVKVAQEQFRKTYGETAYNRMLAEIDGRELPPMKSMEELLIEADQEIRPTDNVYTQSKTKATGRILDTTTANDLFNAGDLKTSTLIQDTYYTKSDKIRSTLSSHVLDMMLPRLLKLAGDVKIHIVNSDSAVFQYPTFRAAGFYDYNANVIVIQRDVFDKDSSLSTHVILHELSHAAFKSALRDNPSKMFWLERAMNTITEKISIQELKRMGIDYGFTNVDEFLAEAWSNPLFQHFLATNQLPWDLAIKLGVPRTKAYTIWQGLLEFVRRTMGLPKGSYNMLDAAVSVGEAITRNNVPNDNATFVRNLKGEDFSAISEDAFSPIEDKTPDSLPIRMLQPALLKQVALNTKNKVVGADINKNTINILTVHQKGQWADQAFSRGMGTAFSDAVGGTAVLRQEIMAGAPEQLTKHVDELSRVYAGTVWNNFQELAHDATTYQVDPSVPLTHKNNEHIKRSEKWAAQRLLHKKFEAEFKSLPEDMKSLWHELASFFSERQDKLSLERVGAAVEVALGKANKQLAKRIHEGTMTEADAQLFLTNTMMATVADIESLKKIKGVYFPKMRRGDYVTTAEYIIPSKYDSNKIVGKEDEYGFDTKAERNAFIEDMYNRDVPVPRTTAYSIDEKTGSRTYLAPDPDTGKPKQYTFVRNDTGTKEVFVATVNNQIVEMHETQAEGLTYANELQADSNIKYGGLEARRDQHGFNQRITTNQMNILLKKLENEPKFNEMNKTQKDLFTQMLDEMTLMHLSNTSPQNRHRLRRNIMGASKDVARNFAEYNSTSASAIASTIKQQEIANTLEDMRVYKDERSNDPRTTMLRSQLLNDFDKIINSHVYIKPTTYNKAINLLMTVSFLRHLGSPAYVMLNGMQPGMITLPYLAGRHGVGKATMAMSRAYRDIGSVNILGSGLKDTKKAFTDYMEGTTNYLEQLHKDLAKQPDGEELNNLMSYLYSTGRINKDAGFEVSELINRPDRVTHFLRRADHIVRQSSIAVETINRAVTAVAAYRLEREKGGSVQEAQYRAQEAVVNTQFDYTPSNSPNLFKNQALRPFLQFKKYSQHMYYLLAKLTYHTFKGATRAEKIEAGLQLTGLLATHMAMAGLLGLPTEPIKIGLLLLAAVGVPVPQWDDFEKSITALSKDMLGNDLGDALTHGLPRLAGIDLHSRVGLNSLSIFGEPSKQDQAHVEQWLFEMAMGPAFGMVIDWRKGVGAALDGNWWKAGELLAPIKFMADTIKAAREFTIGKQSAKGKQTMEPVGILPAITRAIGFKPAKTAQHEENQSAAYANKAARDAQRSKLISAWVNASGGDRAAAKKDIDAYNKTIPRNAIITTTSLHRALQRRKSDKKYFKGGIQGTKQNIDLLQGVE